MKKYFSFKATLSRTEFWQGFLGVCATGMALGLFAGTGIGGGAAFAACFIPMMGMLVVLLPLWVSMRLRDAGHSPYWAIPCCLPPFLAIGFFAAVLLPSARPSGA
jgi:uncharacterized membrane protein YhaH (DUF805 family)